MHFRSRDRWNVNLNTETEKQERIYIQSESLHKNEVCFVMGWLFIR